MCMFDPQNTLVKEVWYVHKEGTQPVKNFEEGQALDCSLNTYQQLFPPLFSFQDRIASPRLSLQF